MTTLRPAAPRGWLRHGLAVALATLLLASTAPSPARAQTLTEAQLRARFLLNFLRFTEWPESLAPKSPLWVCVLGADNPLNGALEELHGNMAAGHPIEIRTRVGIEQAAACDLLYVPDSELRRLAGAREAIGRKPVLIVGESEAALDRGGMIALRNADRHLSFVVSLAPSRRASLSFSPQMLHAAAEVVP